MDFLENLTGNVSTQGTGNGEGGKFTSKSGLHYANVSSVSVESTPYGKSIKVLFQAESLQKNGVKLNLNFYPEKDNFYARVCRVNKGGTWEITPISEAVELIKSGKISIKDYFVAESKLDVINMFTAWFCPDRANNETYKAEATKFSAKVKSKKVEVEDIAKLVIASLGDKLVHAERIITKEDEDDVKEEKRAFLEKRQIPIIAIYNEKGFLHVPIKTENKGGYKEEIVKLKKVIGKDDNGKPLPSLEYTVKWFPFGDSAVYTPELKALSFEKEAEEGFNAFLANLKDQENQSPSSMNGSEDDYSADFTSAATADTEEDDDLPF